MRGLRRGRRRPSACSKNQQDNDKKEDAEPIAGIDGFTALRSRSGGRPRRATPPRPARIGASEKPIPFWAAGRHGLTLEMSREFWLPREIERAEGGSPFVATGLTESSSKRPKRDALRVEGAADDPGSRYSACALQVSRWYLHLSQQVRAFRDHTVTVSTTLHRPLQRMRDPFREKSR